MISRTGFTGDLGYELWVDPRHALMLWDAIFGVTERGLYDVRDVPSRKGRSGPTRDAYRRRQIGTEHTNYLRIHHAQ